jgi:cytochrome c oxidase subunit 4
MSYDRTPNDSHGDAGHGHGAHVLPVSLLATVLVILLALTGLTVWTGRQDLHGLDLGIAMIIATVKASFVCLIFMHLKWDRRFNGMIFLFAVLLVGLFLAFTTLDLGQYQPNVAEFRAAQRP